MIIRLSIYEVGNRLEKSEKFYFEEDCSGFLGSHFRKGKEITRDDLKRLYKLGYNILWVNDKKKLENLDDSKTKTDSYIYEKKCEIEAIIGRGAFVFDENQVRKPESALKFLEGQDLLKQNINALQKDGSKLLLKKLYGDRGKKIIPLKSVLDKILNDNISKVGFFDNISIGNVHLKKKDDNKLDKKDIEQSNFYLKTSVTTGLAVLITLNNILVKRNPGLKKTSSPKIDSRRRVPYSRKQLINIAFAASFADMGYLHIVLDNNIKKLTKPLFKKDGELINNGQVDFDDRVKNVLDRHSNVISNILISDSSDPSLITGREEVMLKYGHRYLNGAGYPKRNMVVETVTRIINEETNETKLEMRSLFDSELKELPRLLGIINTLAELILGTPWRLPVERDMAVRYLKINSCYPCNAEASPDKEGIWDFNLRDRYKKRYDAFLVDSFLNSIYLYKIGEKVPIYDISKPSEIKFDAIVIEYTKSPNRPMVLINDKSDGNKEIDLSKEEFEHYFVGEYCPCAKLRLVLEHYTSKNAEQGIYLHEDLYIPEDTKTMKNDISKKDSLRKKEIDKEVDNLFEEGPDIDELTESASDQDVDDFLSQFIDTDKNKKDDTEKKTLTENEKIINKNENKSLEVSLTGLFDDDNINDEEIMEDLNYVYKLTNENIKELYGLAIINDSSENVKEATMTHLAIELNEKPGNIKYKIVKLHPAYREKIKIYNNPKAKNVPIDYINFVIGNVVNKDSLSKSPYISIETYKEGDFFYLNYVSELDPKKNPDYKNVDANILKGTLFYLVKIVNKTDIPDKPVIKCYALYKKEEGKNPWVKDKNYGRDIDLRKYTFFILGKKLSSSEFASVIGFK